jgi:hypothetical protein
MNFTQNLYQVFGRGIAPSQDIYLQKTNRILGNIFAFPTDFEPILKAARAGIAQSV